MRTVLLLLMGLITAAPVRAQEPSAGGKKSAANEPLRQELLQMMKEDQDARFKLLEWMKAHGAIINKDNAKKAPMPPEIQKLQEIDKKNTKRLQAILDKHGWPGKSLVGEDGSRAAWLLVQHADQDRPFQKRCLKLMETAAEKDEVAKADLAYLVDRVLMGEGKKQRYGTQFKQEKGDWIPHPIEDEANVDKRRAGMGLPALAEYKKLIQDAYKAKEDKK